MIRRSSGLMRRSGDEFFKTGTLTDVQARVGYFEKEEIVYDTREIKKEIIVNWITDLFILVVFLIAGNDLLNAVLLCERKDNKFKQQ